MDIFDYRNQKVCDTCKRSRPMIEFHFFKRPRGRRGGTFRDTCDGCIITGAMMETVGQIIEFTATSLSIPLQPATKDSKPGDVSLSIPLQPATKDSKPGDVSLAIELRKDVTATSLSDETSTSLISSVAEGLGGPNSLISPGFESLISPGFESLVADTALKPNSLISPGFESLVADTSLPSSLVAEKSLPSSLVAETKRECTTCGKSKYLKNFYENRSECHVCRKSLRRVRRANCFAIPKWLTKEHYSQMEDLYRRAMDMRERGIDVEVDHMEPLHGADRCGLHVPWNLQILAHDINAQKGNMGYAEWCAVRRTHKIRNSKPTKLV